MWIRAEASDASSKPDKRAHVSKLEFVIQYHNTLCKRTACRQIIRELGSHAMQSFFPLGMTGSNWRIAEVAWESMPKRTSHQNLLQGRGRQISVRVR